MTIFEEKKKLRTRILAERAKQHKPEKQAYDQWICMEIWKYVIKDQLNTVHCYIPMGAEIDITPLIEKMLEHRVRVVAPKTLPNRQLQNLELKALNELEKGVFGTRHPANTNESDGPFDLIIVPGLAFTESNYRLGYGGGYYDSFLAKHPEAYKLGVCYPFQIMKTVPLEKHDVQLDAVLFQSERTKKEG